MKGVRILKRKQKKAILYVVVILIFLSGFIVYNNHRKSRTIPIKLELQDDAYNYLKKHNLTECKIKQCPSYENLMEKYSVSEDELNVTVTDEEVHNYIKQIMKSYEKLVNVKDHKKVRKGDFVTVSFSVFFHGSIVSPRKNVTLKVGAGYYDRQFESVLVGMKKGEVYKRKLTVPDNFEDKAMIGQKEIFKIRVLAIQKYKKYKLNNKFARRKLGVKDVEEYYQIARESVLKKKKSERINYVTEDILSKIISSCQFQMNQEEVVKYAMNEVEQEEKLAEISGMTMDEYIKESGKDKKSFFSSCYQSAEKKVKQILVIGILAEQMHIELSDDDLSKMSDSEDLDARYALVKHHVMLKFL